MIIVKKIATPLILYALFITKNIKKLMKTYLSIGLFAALLILITSCKQIGNSQQVISTENKDIFGIDSLEYEIDNAQSIEFETLSDKDMWLKVVHGEQMPYQLKRLIDSYNAFVIQNSIMTDFDMLMRIGLEPRDVIKKVEGINIERITDPEVRAKIKDYKQEMLFLLSVNPDSVDHNEHNPWRVKDQLYAYLSKKYYITTFGEINEDTYWDEYNNCSSVPEMSELIKKRGNPNMVKELKDRYEKATDFDARCVYAIELAHAYEADKDSWGEDFKSPAIPIMEALMKEQKYSVYLNELWQKWRVLYQDSKGASKDSTIPNRLYNAYRNMCCCTVLSYLEKNPQDIKAVNCFLTMASKENIFREGEFSYGNQNAIEKYYLFPEIYHEDKDEE